ncbi:MAG: histidine kinase [Sphingobacteriales bacterium]|nr:histidine kinase [Sphingobacteriales bacterium]
MKEFIKKSVDLHKIEFWAATCVYVFSIFVLVSGATDGDFSSNWTPYSYEFEQRHLIQSYFANYFFPQIVKYTFLYCSYLLLNYYIVPAFLRKENIALNTIYTLTIFALMGLAFGIADTWIQGYLFADFKSDDEVYSQLFKSSFVYSFWLLMMYSLYSVMKYTAQYLLVYTDKVQGEHQQVTRDCISAFILWMIGFFLLLITHAPKEILASAGFIIPYAIGLYWYSFYTLIPQVKVKQKRFTFYLLKVALILCVGFLPFTLLIVIFQNNGEFVAIINLFNVGFQLLVTAPISWAVYKNRFEKTSEIKHLKTALGKSTANFDFLRSQINPHFLFNALNTLYGTAIQENADRTSEGIQKLGDMMRFMLQENMKDRISLQREIDYLNNYIDLQMLRTQTSPDIIIQRQIDEHIGDLQIAPMLLIPFIENAFKHGISLREPSHIKITLQTRENVLYFDVHNSIHLKSSNDPEKDHSGIGLTNVKQRLLLLYPNHELIIRENSKEFFIHLTINLNL